MNGFRTALNSGKVCISIYQIGTVDSKADTSRSLEIEVWKANKGARGLGLKNVFLTKPAGGGVMHGPPPLNELQDTTNWLSTIYSYEQFFDAML